MENVIGKILAHVTRNDVAIEKQNVFEYLDNIEEVNPRKIIEGLKTEFGFDFKTAMQYGGKWWKHQVDNITEKEVFDYLEELRESGIANMLTTVPYIQKKFRCGKGTARSYLMSWVDSFSTV